MKRITGADAARKHFASIRTASQQTFMTNCRGLFDHELPLSEAVRRIVDAVRDGGDRELSRISGILDGEPLAFIEVPQSEIDGAADRLTASARSALENAAGRVRDFQTAAKPTGWTHTSGMYGEIVSPVQRVGAYVPGGTAPLASTVIMTVVPARVAGVNEVVLVTPAPGNAMPHPAVLAAAAIAGADRVFKVGGAQAIAALAYGTETIPKVDVVCGPGNIFVTTAKKHVYGDVGVDGLYGPTETLVIADDSADPAYTAADLLAQAEHDVLAMPVLMATSQAIADAVEAELSLQLQKLDRLAIASSAIDNQGLIVVVNDVDEAIDVANAFAPEHLCMMVRDAGQHVSKVRSAGGLFLGECSAEVMADYVAGPSHVMPTGGTARFASALSVRHFLRVTPFLDMDEDTFLSLANDAAELATLEGLGGHAGAAEIRRRRMLGE